MLGQKVTPLDRVGLYVPGGKAAYPSSVLMNAIPAKVAGVKRTDHGRARRRAASKNPLVLAAACDHRRRSRVHHRRRAGGGALAYGTQTMPQVDKIVGPGNAYVADAKRRVFGIVGIDMVAGPSEILIISDGSGNPTGWRWTSSRRPSTTNWRSPSCSAPTPPSSTACRPASTACCRPCRAAK
jgi:histidinol dehydrogenase